MNQCHDTEITRDKWAAHDWEGRAKNQWWAFPGLEEKILSTLVDEQCLCRVGLVDRLVAAKRGPVRVLELGCGQSPISLQLTTPAEIVLVDLVDFKFEPQPNVVFKQLDLNEEFADGLMESSGGQFDIVIISHSAHHIKDQAELSRNVSDLLQDEGILFFDDYIGPRWLEFSAADLAIGRDHLLRLPEHKRLQVEGTIKKTPWRGGYEAAWAKTDPSEACSSDMILPAFMQRFVPTHYWAGGTLLYMVLEFIPQNFHDDTETRQYLNELWSAEQQLLFTGQLNPWFTMMVAQKRRIHA